MTNSHAQHRQPHRQHSLVELGRVWRVAGARSAADYYGGIPRKLLRRCVQRQHVCMHACVHVCLHTCMQMDVYANVFVYVYIHVYVNMCMCVCVFVCVCARARAHIRYLHVYKHRTPQGAHKLGGMWPCRLAFRVEGLR